MMKSHLKYFVLLLCLNFIDGAFRCDYKYSSTSRTWFKVHIMPSTWFNARLRCSLEGATLASPTTPEIMAVMKNITNTTKREIFTGIHAIFSQDYYTLEGTPLADIPVTWAKNEPNNKDDKERCLTLNSNGELADRRCEDPRPYICYAPEKQAIVYACGIDPDYVLDKRTNKCYKLHTVPRNFSRAFMACSAEGGHLVVINSQIEAEIIKDLFAQYPENEIVGKHRKDVAFTGVHDIYEIWDLKTIHGQTLSEAGYTSYSRDQRVPNAADTRPNCVGVWRTGNLIDLLCNEPALYFCEKNPNSCVPQSNL